MAEAKKKPVVPIVIGVVVVAIIGVVAFLMLTPKKKVNVPSVTYYYQAQAEKMLADAGLKLGEVKEEQSTESYEGLILNQSPDADASVDEGSAVDITIAKGRPIPTSVVVPDLKALGPEDAEIALFGAIFFPLNEGAVYSDDVEPGKVCEQTPAAGTSVPIDVTDFQEGNWPVVSFKTSLGKEQVKVPDVVGKSEQEARDALGAAGIAVDTSSSYSETVEQGHVISQSIAKDITVAKGTIVTIEISAGKKPVNRVNVPDIRTYSLDEAKRALESAGLNYTYSGDVGGRVITVNPMPGTQVDQGSSVSFTIQRTAEQIQQEEQERQRKQQEEQQRQQQEQQRQQEEQQRQQEEQQRQQEEQQRQQEEQQRQQEEQQRQQEEQQRQQEQQEPAQEYISEADAAESARAAVDSLIGDDEVLNTNVVLEIGGDAPHYVVDFSTEVAGYEVTLDAYTGEIWNVDIID